LTLDGATASFFGAISETIGKIDIAAQATNISWATSKAGSLAEHIADTHLTALRQTAQGLGSNGSNKSGDGEKTLHFDGLIMSLD